MISYVTPKYSGDFKFTTEDSINNKSFVFISDKLIVYNNSLSLHNPKLRPINKKYKSLSSNKLYQLIWISFCPNKYTKYKINHNTPRLNRRSNIHQLSYTCTVDNKLNFLANIKNGGNGVPLDMSSLTKIQFANSAILSFNSHKFTLDNSYKITAPVKKSNTNIFMVHGDKYDRKVISKKHNNKNNSYGIDLEYEHKYQPDENNLNATAIMFK
jgi:hypothetical protein